MAQSDLALAVVRQLKAWGVSTVFGVPGDDILPFLDALARDGGIRFIGAAHEAGAAFMAAGWARMHGELGVCAASAAGAVNLLQGLAGAYLDGLPVLALTGQVETAKLYTPAKQYYDQQRLIGNFAVLTAMVAEAPAGLRLLIRAMASAVQGRTVSHLSFPKDLWSRPVEAESGAMPPLAAAPPGSPNLSGDMPRVANLMRSARKPMLIAGTLARGHGEEIRRLASSWGAGIITAQDAKGVLPEAWPEVIGGVGEAWTPAVLGEADCLLLFGEASFEEAYLPKAPVIQAAPESTRIDDRYLWDSLAGEPGGIIAALNKELRGHRPDAAWLARIGTAKEEILRLRREDADRAEQPIHPARLMAELSRAVADDAVIAIDEGAFNHWFDRSFQARAQTVLLSARWRAMGAGLPMAVAAQLRQAERQVVALTGDGGLLMSLGELATVVKYGLPVTIVVVNNHAYGLERDRASQEGMQPTGLAIASPLFSRLAPDFGLLGFYTEEPGHLAEVLAKALSLRRPALIEVACADVRLPEMAGVGAGERMKR